MKTTKTTVKTIAGCDFIAERIEKSGLLGKYYELLAVDGETDERGYRRVKATFGDQPIMPISSVSPVEVVVNGSNIKKHIEELPLTWIKVDRVDRWGVYHTVIALFGDKHWVAQDRAGAQVLRIFNEKFS